MIGVEAFANQVIDQCDSTNDLAKILGEKGYPQGTWVSARIQHQGKGRLGRSWKSMEGNLFLSILARPGSKVPWTWIPLAAAVAGVEAIHDLTPHLEIKIKWPNDLLLSGAKVGGILCEGMATRSDSFVVVGFGINCQVAPRGLDQPTNYLDIPVELVRSQLISSLQNILFELCNNGYASIAERYQRYAFLQPGKEIVWGCLGGETANYGKVIGIGKSGELLVQSADTILLSLFAEDVKIRAVPKADDESLA